MRTLFTKILLWSLLTVIVSFTASFYIARSFQPRPSGPVFNFNGRPWELLTAQQAWESGGKEGLDRMLTQFKDVTGAEGVLADRSGRDVLTGHDWSSEIRAGLVGRGGGGRGNPMFPFVRIESGRRGGSWASSTVGRDGRYQFVVIWQPREQQARSNIEVPSQTWWMLGIFCLFCYLLARQLTSPLRSMQKTVERFGQGDFSARVNSRRHDELGQLARTVDRMAERIDLLVKSQRRLLQDISHELRSPLARLGVAVELARGGGDPEIAFNRVEKEADRLNTLVGELIQVTRAEGDPAGLATEAVRLDDLVRMILDDVHIEADKRQITLHPQICDAEMQGNPELLRRAIENIVRNAIRYSPEGCQVDVTLAPVGGFFRVTVRDYGSGVPEESLPSIFDPFYRVEKDRGRLSGGVGLGLAIAKRAVELRHGSMRAANVHPGLRVEIDLPAAVEAAAHQPELVSAR